MKLKFSVITPSFQHGDFIEDTIKSVIEQNYDDYEHIIIDAVSTDDTINILKKYHHLKWVSEKDFGPANAINKGFRMANGDILSWLNSDDYYDKGVFAKISEIFANNPEIDIIFGNLTVVDKQKRVLHVDKTEKFNLNYLLNQNADVIRQPSSFFRKKIFDKVGPLNEDLKLVFDYELFIKMLKYANPLFIDCNLSFYRDYPETLTRKNIKKQAVEIYNVARKNGGKLFSRLNYTNLKKYFIS